MNICKDAECFKLHPFDPTAALFPAYIPILFLYKNIAGTHTDDV